MYVPDFLLEQSKLVLTGIIISFLSSIIYRTTPTGFVSGGKYRTKEGAIFIYLGATVVLGIFTPLIYGLSGLIVLYIPIISIIGTLIICANFIINQSVPTWKHTSPKTLVIYLSGVLLILIGYFINI